ncbi:hypothetical protein [Micromonospora zamorensis]|uniref:hypothetical protein n=1 Tax=Micromonospora zamorensis TaxID=709883 RepID=UPI0033B23577
MRHARLAALGEVTAQLTAGLLGAVLLRGRDHTADHHLHRWRRRRDRPARGCGWPGALLGVAPVVVLLRIRHRPTAAAVALLLVSVGALIVGGSRPARADYAVDLPSS